MAAAYNDQNFRAFLTVFQDTTQYPEAQLLMYWTVASDYISTFDSTFNVLNGASLQLALDLLCAHITVLLTQDQKNVDEGENPGQPGSIETSASVGSVSVSSLPPPIDNDPWRYWMNQTQYGQQLLALLSVKAVGGLYVGGLDERSGFRKAGGVFW
jgi:hypothetical protein